jgi:pilus assembly protein CpaE
MNTPKPEPDWSLASAPEDDFVLEEDDTFASGAIQGSADLPPFDEEFDTPAPPLDVDGEDPFGLNVQAPMASAAAAMAPMPPMASAANDGVTTNQPVPRITIHACCDRSEVSDMIAAIAADRRMARAEVSVEMGGMDAALTRFANQSSPNLLILDTLLQGQAMLHNLDRLANMMEAGSKVVIIGAVNDIGLFRELMNRGVSEYIVPPFQATDLIQSICNLYVNPDKPFAGRVISVIGARGGVGASTIAHNLAWSIAERQEAGATLLDLDLSFGTAALDFNQDPPQTLADALTQHDRVDDTFLERVTTKHTQRLQMLTAPATLEREFELDPVAFESVIDRVRRSSPFIVLDLPHTWNSWVKQTLLASDDVVIVASPDLASLRNAKNIHDLLKSMRPYDSAPQVALNMVGVPKRPEIPFKDFAEALGATPVASFAFDPALFGMAANNGQMVGEMAATHKISLDIDTLAATLTGRKPPEPTKKQNSLSVKIPFLKR